MKQTQGFTDPKNPGFVCRLHKSLYGLKQAPRAWFDKLRDALLSLSFTCAKSNQSLFFRIIQVSIVFILIYVDDIIVTGSKSQEVQSLIDNLKRLLH